jgi:hypothetical protein
MNRRSGGKVGRGDRVLGFCLLRFNPITYGLADSATGWPAVAIAGATATASDLLASMASAHSLVRFWYALAEVISNGNVNLH